MKLVSNTNPGDGDNTLLDAIVRGDRRALEQMYLAYYRRLARFLSRFSAGPENVDEIINDTFLIVWQHAKDFRKASRVSTWIIGIAYRLALKSLRQRNAAARPLLTGDPEARTDPNGDLEVRDWVDSGLSLLPPEQRLALELAYRMGHSLEEIAAITGCPVGTVKARMFHAREKLRHSLPGLGGSMPAQPLPDPGKFQVP
jgi:RNA polymerase sigma-70 factor (ECF subfamily)